MCCPWTWRGLGGIFRRYAVPLLIALIEEEKVVCHYIFVVHENTTTKYYHLLVIYDAYGMPHPLPRVNGFGIILFYLTYLILAHLYFF